MDTAQVPTPMQESDLLPADEEILDVLARGRATKGMLVDETSYTRNTVYNRLNILVAAEHVREVHDSTRLFELVSDPRDGARGWHPILRGSFAAGDGENNIWRLIDNVAVALTAAGVDPTVVDRTVWSLVQNARGSAKGIGASGDDLARWAREATDDHGLFVDIDANDVLAGREAELNVQYRHEVREPESNGDDDE